MARKPDKIAWLKKLEPVTYDAREDVEGSPLEQMNLAPSLLALAEINHESEYKLCCKLAEHFLGEVPEPDDADSSED